MPDLAPAPRLRALIYNRVSSDPTGRGISVASQDTENRTFCDRQGWDVVRTVTDNDRSASRYAKRGRDGYSEVRRSIVAGEVDVFVCWEASRADRDLEAYAQLRNVCANGNVLWAYSGRIYDLNRTDDRFTTGMDVLLAEREAGAIRDRIMRGVHSAVAQGKPHGTVPYGYMRERDPRTGAIAAQIPDPETAPVVRSIVASMIAGATLYDIVQRLNSSGVPTPLARKEQQAGVSSARVWNTTSVRRLLESRSMIGVRTHHGEAHATATWDPIVSAADWARCQEILADPKRVAHHRGLEPKHLLSGIATCAVCGAWLRGAKNRGRAVYQCAGWGPGDPRGKGHVSKGPLALCDAVVITRTVARLRDPRLAVEIARRETATVTRRAGDAAELSELQARMAEFEASAKSLRGPAVASVVAIIADYADQIEAVTARIAASGAVPEVVLNVAGPDAAARWRKLDSDIVKQRTIVRALFQVIVHRSTRGHGSRGFDESSIELVPLL